MSKNKTKQKKSNEYINKGDIYFYILNLNNKNTK